MTRLATRPRKKIRSRYVARLLHWAGSWWVVTQLCVVIVATLLTAAAAWQYSGASGSWQESVRAEVVRSNALQEDVRAVYGDEAPAALRLAIDEATIAELRPLSDGNQLAASQYAALVYAVRNLRQQYIVKIPYGLLGDPQYALPGGGSDVIRRLRVTSDLRREQQRLAEQQSGQSPPDPDISRRAGDALAVQAGLLGLVATALIAVIAVAAAVRRQSAARRKREVVQLAPQPRRAAPGRPRRVVTWVLAIWTAGLLLPIVQLALGAEEQRSLAASARLAVALTSDIAVSNARSAFGVQALQLPVELSVRATARQIGALDAAPGFATQANAVAAAEERAALTATGIGTVMARAPTRTDGLAPRVVTALTSTKDDWPAAGRVQQAAINRANRWGASSNYAVVLIAVLVALAAGAEVHQSHVERNQR